METASFDTQKLKNGDIQEKEYLQRKQSEDKIVENPFYVEILINVNTVKEDQKILF